MIQRVVKNALKGRRFSSSIDVGCGTGDGGVLARPHTNYLVGVDPNTSALREAHRKEVYDELYVGDMRNFPFDSADSVFMFDSLEHISKAEGYRLLEKIGHRFTMITTPWWSTPVISDPSHKCVWSERELNEVGFSTLAYSFMPDFLMYIIYGGIILGVRERHV
ncbi:hypothetical protein ES703_69624 [subsurface metagenome]